MTKANPKLIGAFVVGGVALTLLGIATFGSFKFFEQRLPVVMYFEGNLTGLDIGAPLVFQGVRIGTVTDVRLEFNTETRQVVIPVIAEVEPDRFVLKGPEKEGRNVPLLIKEGLRAQLATQSLLTGKRLVSLDLRPDTPAELRAQDKSIVEIPTIPSAMEELQASLQSALNKLEELPLHELTEELRTLLRDTDAAVRNLDTKTVTAETIKTLQDAQSLLENVQRRIDTLTPPTLSAVKNADRTLTDARKALADLRPLIASGQHAADSADRLLNTAQGVIQPGSPLHRELIAALRELTNAARSIRVLADNLERDPNSILFGKTSAGSAK